MKTKPKPRVMWARAERAEAESAGRLKVLNEKADELRREWQRAEKAEAALAAQTESHAQTVGIVADAIRERDALARDKARLDWLETQSTPGIGWQARNSSRFRGYRLHQDPTFKPCNVRDAIDAAMKGTP